MQTRKKVIKTVYKDENDSEPEESGDFSDSGSDAKISDVSSSEDEEQAVSSGEEFEDKESKSSKATKSAPRRRPQFAKNFIQKILDESQEDLGENSSTKAFSVKDLTDADKLLPSFLNLSESDSSEDESPRKPPSVPANTTFPSFDDTDSDHETKMEYQDVWSENIPDKSDEIAQKTFKELEIHKTKVEQTKASILNYKAVSSRAFDVRDLLAQGEELLPEPAEIKNTKRKKKQYVSDSEMEDWEEVKESKSLPASGLQVVVDFPDTVRRKSKKIDVEMMMRRKMNRVKKEYQVYMHKVHVLCWLGHGTIEKTPTKTDPKKTKKTLKDMDDELRGRKTKISPKNAVRMEESLKNKAVKKKSVKGKSKTKSDSDYEPEALSDDDFKPSKISPKPSDSRKIDRRVLSTDDEAPRDKTDVWCEVFVEELEQWIAVDVVKGQVHCTNEIYSRATHPVCYVVGWDNNNYLKDLTRRYVPHWNTVTSKQRAEPVWWDTAISPWKGPRTPRDREEDEALDRMQLDAPLPTSIAEYKNHPLYVLKRHLLKYEALYPPNTATLGFVRGEAVYPRDSVCVCHSRHTWYKLAKVVRQGEQPYKIVKANPRWDKVARKVISVDEPLETFGSWQVEDFEPPAAENGVVPRNAYGNVELFKACMLPKGTVHIKLPGLNKVANKLNIDCAPALTGFDGNRGWPRPLYDGFVVCQEFEEIITQAWLEDQEKMERREKEKTEARVFGNWKRLIKGLMITERLKLKYGFEEPSTSDKAKGPKGSRFVTKKKK
ncbi:DNA repair protein complementing XP-C cells homolog [Leguminivora glycinivorella]|uniref:DNA repair protein complementing XP-C cells homolog n=1 Tax=Leguminivora glycinivorella TaxID=1035111 RepID=UPI00200E4757|nr:DNA repair protein complementing XP-C cells homolog [Leguminivora glycinivorella]